MHQNSIDPSAKWLVQKFGGTSIGKFAVRIAEDIVSFVPFFLPGVTHILAYLVL
jgi:hypothetical protein